MPDTTGEKNVIADLVAGALVPLIDAVKEIYLDAEEADRLTRLTIQNQLEATKWPAFAEIHRPTDRSSGAGLGRAGARAGGSRSRARRPLRPPDAGARPRHAHRGIKRADVDAAGRYAVTGSDDKTVRVWSVEDGRLLRTIRLPAGPGNVGKVYAVAISPDGELVAAGGWTGTERRKRSTSSTAPPAAWRPHRRPAGGRHSPHLLAGRAHLAATLGGANGLRVYDRRAGWAEVARDTDYGDGSYGADFSPTAGWRRRASTATSGCTTAASQHVAKERRPADERPRHRLQPRRNEARGRLR